MDKIKKPLLSICLFEQRITINFVQPKQNTQSTHGRYQKCLFILRMQLVWKRIVNSQRCL